MGDANARERVKAGDVRVGDVLGYGGKRTMTVQRIKRASFPAGFLDLYDDTSKRMLSVAPDGLVERLLIPVSGTPGEPS